MEYNKQQVKTYTKEHHYCHLTLQKCYKPYSTVAGTDIGFFSPRIAYILKGECTVVLPEGQTLECKEGDVWYLPKNKPYRSEWRANGYIEFYVVEFEADFFSEKYTSFQSYSNTGTLELFHKLFRAKEDNDEILSVVTFYKILDKILPFLKREESQNTERILSALKFLNENFSLNVKVSDLAKMCFMSESRFYQLFKNITKKTPIEYKNSIKLSYAVNLLRNFVTLEEICERLNFSSPAFLRRLLKKHYNKTPKEIRKEEILL